MIGVNELKDVLDYIDIGITNNNNNNNNKTHYILFISMIHDFFLNYIGIDFGIRYNILRQANLMITKLAVIGNSELRDDWLKIRNLIVPDLIEKNEEIDDDDCYYIL